MSIICFFSINQNMYLYVIVYYMVESQGIKAVIKVSIYCIYAIFFSPKRNEWELDM